MPPRVTSIEIMEGPPLVVRITRINGVRSDLTLRDAAAVGDFLVTSTAVSLTAEQRAKLTQLKESM